MKCVKFHDCGGGTVVLHDQRSKWNTIQTLYNLKMDTLMLFVTSSFEYMNQFTLTHETAEFKVLKDIAGGQDTL